ncbi:hypothetical protein COU77_01730 [Candidatus Peregrinibacteria bacterium CG10_big_fil_rev_8_21_14_0_10_49_16]|nr:MAG: hypothetical protein COW95_01595 [Candidatus Peregrinibacteria bacterium CG22_combo_CG10-13_8_21_14_all_49_11]PIR52219.1 MAG: hypothetical protein COU77_01730 [Candidatus Peregrinibacteria bacterium CG10_big_fil_rev_8_21_14_0_10_49_16]
MKYLTFILVGLVLCANSTIAQEDGKKAKEPAIEILVNDHSKGDNVDVFIYVPAKKFVYKNMNKNAFKGIKVGYLFGDKMAYIAIEESNTLVFFENGDDPEITTFILGENANLRILLPKGTTFKISYD